MASVYMGKDVEDFIFGEGTSYETEVIETPVEESKNFEVTDEEMNQFGVIECVDDPEIACYRIALENEQNYNMIMNAMMTREFSVLESTGEEMVYEAVNIKGFFKSVQEALGRFWAKVQGIFKNVMDKLQDLVSSNKDFVKKYKGKTMQRPEKEKKFKGYEFEKAEPAGYVAVTEIIDRHVDASKISSLNDNGANEFATKFRDEFGSLKDNMRGAVVYGVEQPLEEKEFLKEAQKRFFGSEKKDLELVDFSHLIKRLEGAKDAKDSAKKSYKAAADAVKKLRTDVKQAESALVKEAGRKNATGGMKVARCMTDAINASLGIMARAMSVEVAAISARARQDRAMAAFWVSNQPKAAAATTESAEIDDLGIVLI